MKKNQSKKLRKKIRIRAKIFGSAKRPRLAVFRSNQHIFAQIINDELGQTLVAASDLDIKKTKTSPITKQEIAKIVGQKLAKKAKEAKISKVVFDRGGFKFHGRVKALAEEARKAGLIF